MTTTAARRWHLTLYVSGASPRSTAALEAVRRLTGEELADHRLVRSALGLRSERAPGAGRGTP